MARILSFRDLQVWKLGMQLVVTIYQVTEHFPAAERFGLASQIRRAAVSIPSNLAEGHARGDGAFLNHVRIALGSEAELGTAIELAARLGFMEPTRADLLLAEITELRKLLYGLRRALERRRVAAGTAVASIVLALSAVLS